MSATRKILQPRFKGRLAKLGLTILLANHFVKLNILESFTLLAHRLAGSVANEMHDVSEQADSCCDSECRCDFHEMFNLRMQLCYLTRMLIGYPIVTSISTQTPTQ